MDKNNIFNVPDTYARNADLIVDMVEWLDKNGFTGNSDMAIYGNGYAVATWDTWGNVEGEELSDLARGWYFYEDKYAGDYFEYANERTVSMSFEGTFNHVMNGYVDGWIELYEQFMEIPRKYGLFFEMGYSWTLSAHKI